MWGEGGALGVYCVACKRRGIVSQQRLGAHRGNMKELRNIGLACTGCGIHGDGNKEFQLFIVTSPQDAEEFLGGEYFKRPSDLQPDPGKSVKSQ
jgi:hypothetical protein